MNSCFSITGKIKIAVIDHNGDTVREYPWQKNLLLDRGLNALAVNPDNTAVGIPFAELFAYAIKGTGNDITSIQLLSNTYTLTVSGNLGTVTRASGSRNFTVADVGWLIRPTTTPFTEGIITDLVSTTQVTVRPLGTNPNFTGQTYAGKSVFIYNVSATAVSGENGRTNNYSSVSGDNGTTDENNKRTLKRTFIFDTETVGANVEAVTGTYNFIVNPANSTQGLVQRASGTRNFGADDIGKYIEFPNQGGQYGKIIGRDLTNPNTIAFTDRPPTSPFTGGAGINPNIYGYISYGQVGFSNSDTAAPNILVTLASPVLILGPNPETTGQRLKVTYQFSTTFTPATSPYPTQTSGFIAGATAGNMASSQAGSYAIEALGSSRIDQDGASLLDSLGLEPGFGGSMALSTTSSALVGVGVGTQPSRTAGIPVDLETQDYVDDSFTRLYKGVFDINDSPGNAWRVVGIYDEGTAQFLFTYLFNQNQQKIATTTLTLNFRKTWGRDLS